MKTLENTIFINYAYCMDLPPDLRANCDYVFVLREPVIQTEKLYKSFSEFSHLIAFKRL